MNKGGKMLRGKIKKFYSGTSIKTKWSIFVIILVLYPMILIGYVGYANYEEMITKYFIQGVQKDVAVVTEQFQEEMQQIEKFVKEIQQDESIHKFTTQYYNKLKDKGIDIMRVNESNEERKKYDKAIMGDYYLKQTISGYLKSLILSRQDVTVAAYQFAEGESFGYVESKDKSDEFKNKISFQRNSIFENMNEVLKDNNIGYYVDSENNIYIGKKMFYRATGEHCGTAIFKLDMAYYLRKYYRMVDGANEAVFVVANGSQEILKLGNLSHENQDKLIDFVANYPEPGAVYKEESRKQAVIYNIFTHHNITIGSAIYISTDILLADIRTLSRFIFVLCISILPIFLLLANKLYKELIQPIYILSDKMQQIEKGEIGTEVKSERTDEFGYVFTSFNRMSKQLEYLVNCVYKEQIALKNAELKALRAQINPHFLYNTLEMINWKARISGETDISEMIEALSGILEVNIDRREEHVLTIRQEIEYIKNYIFLIQKRFGDRVKFQFEVQDYLLDYKIPKLILQPIVENAITHGIEMVGHGIISINISEVEEGLYITIKDNGRGITEEKLLSIKEKLEKLEKLEIDNKEGIRGHIGIINVQKRIKLLYGETYGLKIESVLNEGTCIQIVLPKTKSGNIEI